MNTGPRPICNTEPVVITSPGLAATPVARSSVEPTMESMNSGKPSMYTAKYSVAIASTAPWAPSNTSMGSANAQPRPPMATPTASTSSSAWVTSRAAWRRSPAP